MTPVYDVYESVHLFIKSKTDILNVTIFKYSLRTFWRNYNTPKIPINLSCEKSDHI